MVSSIYGAFSRLFSNNCIQIGSYARFTAIRPLHDLDIVYVLGLWDENAHSPEAALRGLHAKIGSEFKNPTDLSLKSSLQTHSITVVFSQGAEEVLAVDIVPAFKYSKNEFGDDVYKVPELVYIRRGQKRSEYYKGLVEKGAEPCWITSDPRGYIEIASRVNATNPDFRKAVKFIKAWKYACEEKDSNFKLKSFHVEQIVTAYFQQYPQSDLFGGIFSFFVGLPKSIEAPQIPDRADPGICIDSYLTSLTNGQKEQIKKARDGFLKRLEEFMPTQPVSYLLDVDFYRRASNSEQYLFDFGVPTFLEDRYSFEILGDVLPRDGFRPQILSKTGTINIGRKIRFKIKGNPPDVDSFKWKVKNDNGSPQPRGEITDHRTRNDPENTQYKGNHYVECYALLKGVCVAKARQNVVLDSSI